MGVAGRTFLYLLKFSFAFVIMTIICAVAWETFVDDRLYHCVDGGPIDYLTPGDWVHDHNGDPIQTVDVVHAVGDMSGPDTLKTGWTVARLWYLWFSFVGVSVAISAALASPRWVPKGWREL
jgi:hypothetical protein